MNDQSRSCEVIENPLHIHVFYIVMEGAWALSISKQL